MKLIILISFLILSTWLFGKSISKSTDIFDYEYKKITREMPNVLYEKVVQSYKEGKLKRFNNKRFWVSFGETENWIISANGDTTSHWQTKDIDITISATNLKGQKVGYIYTYQEYK